MYVWNVTGNGSTYEGTHVRLLICILSIRILETNSYNINFFTNEMEWTMK